MDTKEDKIKQIADITGIDEDTIAGALPHVAESYTKEVARVITKKMVAHDLAQASTPKANPFVSYTVDDLRKLPEPGYHINGVLPVGTDTMLFGRSYVGKTLVLLDQLLSMANGIPWMGHDTGSPRDVALVVGEGQRGITKRIDAWLAAHPGTTDERLAIVTAMPDIRSHQQVTYLMQAFVDVMEEHWPQVIAFDTWSRLTVGADNNDATAMTECVTVLAHIREVFGLDASTIVVHHTGHGEEDRPRGSSVFLGAFDVLTRVDPMEIVNTKQKDNDEFETIHFDIVKYGNSVTVEQTSAIGAAVSNAVKQEAEQQRRISEVLHEESPLSMREVCKRVKGRRADVIGSMELMVTRGQLVESVGANKARMVSISV